MEYTVDEQGIISLKNDEPIKTTYEVKPVLEQV